MKLISMTDFVLGTLSVLDNHNPLGLNEDRVSRYISITNYAKFLKQPLTLGMFIPCDEDGNPLEEPLHYRSFIDYENDLDDDLPIDALNGCREYKEAKEKVLFKGFESKELPERISFFKEGRCIITYSFTKDDFLGNSPTIERVSRFGLTLTYNAIKQI